MRYHDWGFSKIARNRLEPVNRDEKESKGSDSFAGADSQHLNGGDPQTEDDGVADDDAGLLSRHLGLRYLCFVEGEQENFSDKDTRPVYRTRRVADWIQEHGEYAYTGFVFVSYTRAQFSIATMDDMGHWNIPEDEKQTRGVLAAKDRAVLLRRGADAARAAGKCAFWIDFECIRDFDGAARATSQSPDVYRICDVVRVADSMIVIVGPSVADRLRGRNETLKGEEGATPLAVSPEAAAQQRLQQYGSRLWTLPELLLCPAEHRITVLDTARPGAVLRLAKRNLAERCLWGANRRRIRQLMDHYEGSLPLSRLELVSTALECFAALEAGAFARADVVYALNGLLRRRPAVDPADSLFEAFARLSLANDSDALLERLLCLQPPPVVGPHAPPRPWHDLRDAWGARLWDVTPRCQVAGVVDDGTIVLDGAVGATIRWDGVRDGVATLKRPTAWRFVARVLLRLFPLMLIAGIALILSARQQQQQQDSEQCSEYPEKCPSYDIMLYIGVAIGCLVLLVPAVMRDLYCGKFWSTQAMFIGIEGLIPDLGAVEARLFGFNHGRLRWSTAGSTLSRFRRNDAGECEPLPPSASQSLLFSKEYVFTLIDTYAMTATAFHAARPPSVVLVCGQEGGMQRAVLYSYDWKRATFAREAVIRVKTTVLERMFRVERFRFALWRRQDQAVANNDEV